MSITVRTEYGTDNHPQANRWDVTEHGGLWVKAGDSVIAEYPPGAWHLVRDDEEPQDDVPDEGQGDEPVISPEFRLLPSRVVDMLGIRYDVFTGRHVGSGEYAFKGHVHR